MRLGNERRFSDVYSAAGQRERRGNGWADEDFFLHLRIDALLAHTIVVPDTYVLDGAYLTGTSPQELLDGLGRGVARRELPLEVRARRSSLSESLRQFLVRSDSDALNPFPFNAIESAPARHALAATLGTRTSDDLDAAIRREGSVVGGMIGLLRHGLADAGHEAEEDLNRLHEGWSRWLAAEAAGLVRVVSWDAPLDMRGAAALDPVDPHEELGTAAGRRLHADLLSAIEGGSTYRADATLRFYEESRRMTSREELLDLYTVQRWYDDNRHRAIAQQHHCTTFVQTQDVSVNPIGALRRTLRAVAAGQVEDAGREVRAPEEFLATLAGMSGDAYALLAVEREADLRGWWYACDLDALRRVVDGVMRHSDAATQRSSRATSLVELFGGIAGSVGGAALSPDSLMGGASGAVLGWFVTKSLRGATAAADSRRIVEFLIGRAKT